MEILFLILALLILWVVFFPLIWWGVWSDRFRGLTKQIADLAARIQHLEQQIGYRATPRAPLEGHVEQPPEAPAAVPEPPVAAAPAQLRVSPEAAPSPRLTPAREVAQAPTVESAAPPRRPPAPAPAPTPAIADWEAVFGGRWLNRIGVLAIVFGIAFFLKYAFENRWIGETGRVIIGLLAGLAMIGAGERFRRKAYPVYAQGLSGGGILILYLSIFAAFNFYHLIPEALAFGSMVLVTATAIALAVRYDALAISILGILGGFLTPYLLSTGVDQQIALFTYIAILDLGILGIAYYKDWRLLNLLSFILTVSTFLGWYFTFYNTAKLWNTVFFLTLFFLIFAFLAILSNIVHRRRTDVGDIPLILANAALYFGTSFSLLDPGYHAYMGLFAATVAAFYLSVGSVAFRRNPEDTYLILSLLGLAVTFLTLAIPIQLKQQWITIAWAVEGAVFTWIGFREASPRTRVAALVILGLVVIRLLFFDTFLALAKEGFIPLLNKRGFAFAVGIAALFLSAYLHYRHRDHAEGDERRAPLVLIIVANLLALWLFSAETITYFDFKAGALRLTYPASRELENAKQLTLSAIWMVYAMALIILGFLKRFQPIRLFAITLFGITIFKVFLYDLSMLERIYRILSFIGLGLILLVASFLYQRFRQQIMGFVLRD